MGNKGIPYPGKNDQLKVNVPLTTCILVRFIKPIHIAAINN